MEQSEKPIVFICSSALKKGTRLSYRIAEHLVERGLATIGCVEELLLQLHISSQTQRNMIFLNDCSDGFSNIHQYGFKKEKYLCVDITKHVHTEEFDIAGFVSAELIPQLLAKWNRTFVQT